ncbi:MAG: hypothetical protein ACM3O9_03860 [Methylocystaceae bacterium]
MGKRILIILIGAWLACFVMMGAGYLARNQLYYLPLNTYAWLVCQITPYQVWSPTKLPLSVPTNVSTITVIPPWHQQSYQQLLKSSASSPRTRVVCSGLDNYIVGHFAQSEQWGQLSRVIVFDGGHHLATLATTPQVLLVPVTGGLAAHTFMQDAMPVAAIKRIIQELDAATVVVTVPRWAVVKSEWGLYAWARRLQPYTSAAPLPLETVISGSHFAISRGLALAYVTDHQQAQQLIKLLIENRSCYDKVYLAFNYQQVRPTAARNLAQQWEKSLAKPVVVINQPRTVFSLSR